MEIYVHKDHRVITNFRSEYIPRVGEIIHFPHYGGYKVKHVAYRISDTEEPKELMWVELYVDVLKEDVE